MNKIMINSNKTLWCNGKLATMNPELQGDYGILDGYSIVTQDDIIVDIVSTDKIDADSAANVVNLEGKLVTPGFIDCHTHLVFGGNRAGEWEERLNGVSYADISSRGGGINYTVSETRKSSFETLYSKSLLRLRSMGKDGVTTVEAKSGYGLNLESEKKQLEVLRALKSNTPMDISPTLLSAHSVPPEFKGKSDAYLDEVCNKILPKLNTDGLFEAVDIFVENIAFNIPQTKRLFDTAKKYNIPVRAHVEQMSNMGGSSLVAEYKGLSVDHIEYLDEEGIKKLATSGTVAVLLPGAFYFLKEKKTPPVELLRKYRVPIAVSTDYNPGTSPFTSLRMIMNMACTQFSLTPAEVMAGVTRNAAVALNRGASQGQIKKGYKANFVAWDVDKPVEIFYELGYNPLSLRVFNGKIEMFD